MSKVEVKKPKAIVLELTGVIATKEFMSYSDQRKNLVKNNINQYFIDNYPKNKELRLDINFFKMQELSDLKDNIYDENCPKINDFTKRLPTTEQAINHILWKLDNNHTSSALTLFLLHFNEWAYKQNLFITPVYDEIKNVLENWKNQEIDIYVDIASANFVNMILESTTQGDLISYFSGHMNLIQFNGQKTNRNFHLLTSMLQLEAKDILFITRFPDDARSVVNLGIPTFLLIREDFIPDFKNLISKVEEEKKNFPQNKNNFEIERFKSGIFKIASKLNQLNKISDSPLTEDLGNKIISIYDSVEDPIQFNKKIKKNSIEGLQSPSSTITVSDLISIQYITNLSCLSFIN